MPLNIFDHGDGRLNLMGADTVAGWIDGGTIGFGGFDEPSAGPDDHG